VREVPEFNFRNAPLFFCSLRANQFSVKPAQLTALTFFLQRNNYAKQYPYRKLVTSLNGCLMFGLRLLSCTTLFHENRSLYMIRKNKSPTAHSINKIPYKLLRLGKQNSGLLQITCTRTFRRDPSHLQLFFFSSGKLIVESRPES
jgi:hypothetical protein